MIMAFCANCGTKMEDGAKFCPSCGTRAAGGGDAGGAAPVKPAAEKVGNVRKCPACGAPVESFQTRCESCGTELRNTEVSGVLTNFIGEINRLDEEIVREKEKVNVLKTGKLAGWIILNIFTYCIPLVVRTIKRVVFPSAPKLTPLEQRKKSFIENFAVPNNREDIVEFALFASTNVESLMEHIGKSMNDIQNANLWAKTWSDKCRQLSARAGITLAGDKHTLEVINNLAEKPKQLMRKAKNRELTKTGVIAAAAIAVGSVIYITTSGVLVPVPAPKTITAKNVQFTGFLSSYFEAAGDECFLTPDAEGEKVTLKMTVKCISPFTPTLEEKVAEFKDSKGWVSDRTTARFSDGKLCLEDFESTRDSSKTLIASLFDMKAGETQNISVILEAGFGNSKGQKKKALQQLMMLPSFSVSMNDLMYQVNNDTRQENKEENYFGYIYF
jgi:RNA polymerase subunit RPABC4/transcription elongation factor Spt4